jgi:large conductance mechanosensitive channel
MQHGGSIMKSVAQEFRTFILRGSVIDLAVGIIIGAAFGAVVNALVKDLFTPLIAAIFGKPDFSAITFTIHRSQFLIGDFINVLIAFITIALVVFFFVIKPVNFLMSRRKTELPPDPTTRDCPHCLSSIPLKASVCPFCTRDVPADIVATA